MPHIPTVSTTLHSTNADEITSTCRGHIPLIGSRPLLATYSITPAASYTTSVAVIRPRARLAPRFTGPGSPPMVVAVMIQAPAW